MKCNLLVESYSIFNLWTEERNTYLILKEVKCLRLYSVGNRSFMSRGYLGIDSDRRKQKHWDKILSHYHFE
jgi:hypothetical protein